MARLASGHGAASGNLEPSLSMSSSMAQTSDTSSASNYSDTLLHHELSSARHHQQHDSFGNIHHQTPSNSDTRSPSPTPTRHSVTNSLSSLASTSTPVATSHPAPARTTLESSIPHFPYPPFRTPIKRKPLSSSASSLAASLSLRDSVVAALPAPLNPELLPKPSQRFARPPSIDSPTFYDYPHSLRTSVPSSS
jgi:hypothetical protein